MMTSNEVSAFPYSVQWQSIDWKAVEQHVLKLQMRIAKATREGKQGKVKVLQWMLIHSRAENSEHELFIQPCSNCPYSDKEICKNQKCGNTLCSPICSLLKQAET